MCICPPKYVRPSVCLARGAAVANANHRISPSPCGPPLPRPLRLTVNVASSSRSPPTKLFTKREARTAQQTEHESQKGELNLN